MKTAQEFKTHLRKLGACSNARKWALNKTAKEAWGQCERGDWLLWWAQKENVPIQELTLAKGLCAKTVYHLMKDKRSRKAVNSAIAFGKGKLSKEKLDTAADDADDAAVDDAAAAAAYAAYAAYAAADDAAAQIKNQKQTADIVRSIIKPNFL
jgi:hypothetical protein